MTFKELNLDPKLLEGLDAIGFQEATPIQAQAIPLVLENKDLVACAQTGTGKTAAFLLPILNKLIQRKSSGEKINTLIVVPTRELAVQIDQMLEGLSYFTSVSSIAMYGGSDSASFSQQKIAITEGVDIIVATPGKLISHLNMGYSEFKQLKHLVLDEADKMLDMGFYDDIKRIISHLPKKRQTLLFSATMPSKIRKLADEILQEADEIKIAIAKPAESITQATYWLYENQKLPLLKHILKVHQHFKTVIIFCGRKDKVRTLTQELKAAGLSVMGIQSDLEQTEREDIIRKFKNKQFRTLIGTDIIARGIDIQGVDLVINYEVPQGADDYVHRVGRTARADSDGYAFTLVNEREQQDFFAIERMLEIRVTRFDIPEYLGEGPKIQEEGKSRPKNYRRSSSKSKGGGSKKNYRRKG